MIHYIQKNTTTHNIKILFAGTPAFAAYHLNTLINLKYNIIGVLTKPDTISRNGKKTTSSPVKHIALKKNITIFEPTSLKCNKIQKKIKSLNADLMIVVAYGLILPLKILKMHPLGCVNIHASLLPKFRGPAPIQRAILNGEKITGITALYMDEEIDTGDIITTLPCIIENNDTTYSLSIKLSEIGVKCMCTALEKILKKNFCCIKQNNKYSTYAKKINKTEGNINWDCPAIKLNRIIRALNPSPGAYFIYKSKIIKIWESEILTNQQQYLLGTIVTINKKGLQIATLKNILNIKSLQFPGKKPIKAINIYNAYKKFFISGSIITS